MTASARRARSCRCSTWRRCSTKPSNDESALRLQKRKDRKYPTMILGGGLETKLRKDASHVTLHGLLAHMQGRADGGVRAAFGHPVEHFTLALAQLSDQIAPMPPNKKLRHHVRVDGRAAGSHAPDGINEVADIDDPVFE